MKHVGIFPAAFNPFHSGHRDILEKALKVFDHIHVYVMKNPEKDYDVSVNAMALAAKLSHIPNVWVNYSNKPLVEVVREFKSSDKESSYSIIRGLRNGYDLQYEMNNQYWNEDVGVEIPFVYFITDRAFAHVSSSAIRSINKLGLKHEY